MSKELATIKPETIARLDEIARDYQIAKIDQSPFSATFSTAIALNELRSLLTADVMRPIMQLMNTPLGFLTDRNGRPNWKGETKPTYTEEVVRDAVIEATLRGFFVVGNEFNLLAERFYAAKAGLRRKVTTFPGLTNFSHSYSIPKIIGDAGAIVEAKATWKLNGTMESIERTFAVKGDKYAGADSYTGKATRKLLAAVYERISGASVPEGEAEEVNLEAMQRAQGHEVNNDDLSEGVMNQWRSECEDIEKYNARLRAQGVPESDMEPLPPMPERDEIPGLEKKPARQTEKPAAILWREVVVTNNKTLAGKKLGELALPVLEKLRDAINRMSAPVRASKPGIDALLVAVNRGVKELSNTPAEPPAKATPLEGLLNLMKSSAVSEEAVLDFLWERNGKPVDFPKSVGLLEGKTIAALLTDWPELVDSLKAASI